jgi:oxygen-independent coproporphyrinogen-3 oxidase
MGSEHLSSYEVIYEEDTALYAQLHAGEIAEDEDLACAMYEELVQFAADAGFEQYEVANFARSGSDVASHKCEANESASERRVGPILPEVQVPALACQHNINYWRGGSFYGLGPSATGYVRGQRAKNFSNTTKYCECLERGERAIESREQLLPLARAGETAAFGLRMIAGWPFEQFRQVTGHDLRQAWAGEIEELTRQGWGELRSDRFRLTREGLRFADSAAQLFLR